MLSALAAALDGTGPAILPLDPDLPEPVLARILTALAPAALHTIKGTRPLDLPAPRPHGVRDDTAVVIATSGSTGEPKAVELSAAALTASASASLRHIGAGPGERWLCCLPTFHIAGIGVLVTDHNVPYTLAVTNRAYIINDGKILFAGTPADLAGNAEVRRIYLGESFKLN